MGGPIHAMAWCLDCDKEWDGRNAQAVAAKHHYATGHRVKGEVAYAFSYPKTLNIERKYDP